MAITRVDTYSQIKGSAVALPCRVATTTSITLSGTQTIDGVTVSVGDRVLVKNQSPISTNGIYIVASGSWSRSVDMSLDDDVFEGLTVFVSQGSTNSNRYFVVTTSNPVTLSTLVFASQYAIAGTSGTSGLTGSKGTAGSSGTSGVNGTSGTSGTTGTHGISASSGTSGTSATSGSSGTTGTSGTSGTAGTSGTSGSSGTSGTAGSSGTTGANGAQGPQGPPGTQGPLGAPGPQGPQGLIGATTTGATGPQGFSGPLGPAGATGPPGSAGPNIGVGTAGYIPYFSSPTSFPSSVLYDSLYMGAGRSIELGGSRTTYWGSPWTVFQGPSPYAGCFGFNTSSHKTILSTGVALNGTNYYVTTTGWGASWMHVNGSTSNNQGVEFYYSNQYGGGAGSTFNSGGFTRTWYTQDNIIYLSLYTAGGTLTTGGSTGRLLLASTAELKLHDGYIEDGIGMVQRLIPRYFYWRDTNKYGKERQLGFYAEEVNKVSEEAANTPKWETQGWAIHDRSLIAILVKAFQERQAILEELQLEIENLKTQMS